MGRHAYTTYYGFDVTDTTWPVDAYGPNLNPNKHTGNTFQGVSRHGGKKYAKPLICGSRGPRIGEDGQPRCKRPENHEGYHMAAADDGWGSNGTWGGHAHGLWDDIDYHFRYDWDEAGLPIPLI